MKKAKITVTVIVSVELHGVAPEIIANNIKSLFEAGYKVGAITRTTDAELDAVYLKSDIKRIRPLSSLRE